MRRSVGRLLPAAHVRRRLAPCRPHAFSRLLHWVQLLHWPPSPTPAPCFPPLLALGPPRPAEASFEKTFGSAPGEGESPAFASALSVAANFFRESKAKNVSRRVLVFTANPAPLRAAQAK